MTAAPLVSVLMVTHDAWSWTERALAALAEHTVLPYEVIVVDNASSDGTVTRLREHPGVTRLVENERNDGFGPATNQAAALARAPVLVLLNTDALVQRGWLEPLLEELSRPTNTAVAVPKLLHLDGRLQEAGALLASDGTVLTHGDGDDPTALAYCFPRTVDFGAAACMAIRADAFRGAGGFDPLFKPAYYEDADLCLRLAAEGLRTRFVPASTVLHARYGSGGDAQAAVLSERNRGAFVNRWSGFLSARPPRLWPPHPARILAARDAAVAGRVLVLVEQLPMDESAAVLLRTLREEHPHALVTIRTDAAPADDARRWASAGFEVVTDGGPADAWLAGRACHYDVVLAQDARSVAAARSFQPQAIVAAPLPAVGALAGILARGGVAPGHGIRATAGGPGASSCAAATSRR